jgi:putative PEP-CTERM system histidine kinase
MPWVQTLAALLASLASFGLSAVALAQRPPTLMHRSFGLGMAAFGVEAASALVLLAPVASAANYQGWLKTFEVIGILVPLPWVAFAAALGLASGSRSRALRLGGAGLVAAASAVGLAVAAGSSTTELAHEAGRFSAAPATLPGRAGIVFQLLVTAAILAGLEAALRTSKGGTRWRIKYLMVGLIAIFLARFYLLSQTLLFEVWTASTIATQCATLLVGDLVIAASLVRDRAQSGELIVSRRLLYRSAVVAVLGLYLFVAGLMGWLVNWLGIPEALFWGTLGVFVSAIGVTVVLLSEDVRWRVKRAISHHFYKTRYDYREQWRQFTRRLGSLLTMNELAPELLTAVMDTVGAGRGLLYLAEGPPGHLRLTAASGAVQPVGTLELPTDTLRALVSKRAAVPLEPRGVGRLTTGVVSDPNPEADEPGVLVPLIWREDLIGLITLGPERTGRGYSIEDLELLTTLGEQAAGTVVTVQLSEKIAVAREFEVFHRFASFVIHDLKNSIAALSMLTQNIGEHFDDPEFRRDAVHTLKKTVARMTALLARLSAGPSAYPLRLETVDLPALVDETVTLLKIGKRIRFVKRLNPLPPVMADADALQRVIQNLVTNAIEATDGDGQVTLTTYVEDDRAVLCVADNGHGIPPEFLQRSLFAPFRSTKKGGWGIGLYQARNLVEAHGGTIEVASREGEGTSFWVKLPLGREIGRSS